MADPISSNAKDVAAMDASVLAATRHAEAAIGTHDVDSLLAAARELLDTMAILLLDYRRAMAAAAVEESEPLDSTLSNR